MTTTTHDLKVGDELAFRSGYGKHKSVKIHKIKRITKSGRIVCGSYTLNPDLRIRGANAYAACYRGEIITPEIRAQARRLRMLEIIDRAVFVNMTDDTLALIASAIERERVHG